jgi:hypothetical protein
LWSREIVAALIERAMSFEVEDGDPVGSDTDAVAGVPFQLVGPLVEDVDYHLLSSLEVRFDEVGYFSERLVFDIVHVDALGHSG